MLPGASVDVRVVSFEVEVCVDIILVNVIVVAVELILLHFVSAIVR